LFEAQPSDEPPAPPASRVPAPETSVFEPEPDAGATTDVRPLFPEHLPEVRTVPRSNAPDMQIIPRDRRVEIPLRGTTAERGPKPEPDFSGDATLTSHVPAGPQQPELKIEKVAPPEAMVGEPLIYAIHVRNVGRSAAHDVIVEDRIPRGTTLTGTIPRAEMIDKRLIWKLGTIESGQQQTIRVRVTPTDAGEIGSVATVRFAAEVAAATIITATRLELDFSAPGEIAVGEQAAFRFRATNRGVTEARGVYVRSLLPDELQHPGGKDIEYEIGDLSPGETKEVTLSLSAVATGQAQGRAFLTINGKNQAEAAADITVIPSRLVVTRNGPEKRWVGRAADFTNTVANRTQRDVENVTVTETLPRGLELAGVPEGGKYDKQSRTVTWQIPRLPAGQAQTLRLSVVPGEPGTLPSTVRATDSGGHTVEVSSQLEVIGFPALVVDVEHDGKPVAVGEQLALRLKVRNRGSAPAEKVQAVFELPPEMEFVDARGPGRFQREGRLVRFETFETLPAAAEQSFDIVLTAASAGETRVSAQLTSDGLSQPLRHDAPVVIVPADAGEVR
jgi:uncharacterized repeat protein (TIGR01451 family)